MRGPALAVASISVALLGIASGPAPAGAAAPSTIGGELESGSATLPKSAKAGRAQVLAMNIDTGAYGDAAPVGRSGRYALQVPAGKWALLSSIVPLGKPSSLFLSAAIVTHAGEHRTLPLTLRQFKKPRRKKKRRHRHPPKRRAQASNINPKDGVPYKGIAIGVLPFDVSGASDIQVLRTGIAQMIITDLVAATECDLTVVELERRADLEREIALQQSEYFDPSTRIEPGHFIDPELLVRGRLEERPGTPRRVALVAWLEDPKTGAKVSGDVSVVELSDEFFSAEQRLVKLLLRELICPRTDRVAPTTAAEPLGPPAPPKPVANTYSGTFSGTADAVMQHFEWSGTVHMDAAQDTPNGPLGSPPGDYRIFTLSQGTIDVKSTGGDAECGWTGEEKLTMAPGFSGTLYVQLDTPTPAYTLAISETRSMTIQKHGTDKECNGQLQWPIIEPWAQAEKTHTSPSTVLNDSEAHITPSIPYDWDYTTSWNLTPG